MIRICTKRDAVCPHGMSCPYADGYDCTEPDAAHPTVEAVPVAFVDPHSLKFATHYNGVYVATSVDRCDVYSEPVYPASTIAALEAERDEWKDMFEQCKSKHGETIKRANAAEHERDDLALRAAVIDEALTNAVHMRREAERERGEAQLAAGHLRMCVNCGKTRPFHEPKDPLPECVDADGYSACTWDATPQEAWEYWRKLAHDRQDALAAANARVERLEAINPMAVAEEGFGLWAAKPHNLKWLRKIAGTPIENDLTVNMANAFRAALTGGEDA